MEGRDRAEPRPGEDGEVGGDHAAGGSRRWRRRSRYRKRRGVPIYMHVGDIGDFGNQPKHMTIITREVIDMLRPGDIVTPRLHGELGQPAGRPGHGVPGGDGGQEAGGAVRRGVRRAELRVRRLRPAAASGRGDRRHQFRPSGGEHHGAGALAGARDVAVHELRDDAEGRGGAGDHQPREGAGPRPHDRQPDAGLPGARNGVRHRGGFVHVPRLRGEQAHRARR